MGIEQGTPISVNPGLGAGCPPQHPFFKEMCRYLSLFPFTIQKANQLQDLLYQARQNTFYNTDLNAKIVTKKLLACLFTLQTSSTQWIMPRAKLSAVQIHAPFTATIAPGVTKVPSTFGCQDSGTALGSIASFKTIKLKILKHYNGRFTLSSTILWLLLFVGSNYRLEISCFTGANAHNHH